MYSGTTIRTTSGRVMGTHQKVDRVARRQLQDLIPARRFFPPIEAILQFEGKDGPDGIKRKSPAVDEPWHYVDPTNPLDVGIYEYIEDHLKNLTDALVTNNRERAAFEAAWLSHAIVDGLTPAHHYPLSEKIEELWGYPKELRTSIKAKNVVPGVNRRDQLSKNWQYWGAKGVFTNHFMFEFGVASTTSGFRFGSVIPSSEDIVRVATDGFTSLMRDKVWSVYKLDMFDEFYKKGWTRQLAHQTRATLLPIIISTVTLAWYVASERAAEKRAAR